MKWQLFSMARQSASTAHDITARLVQPPSPFIRLATLALALYMGYQAWDYVAPRKAPLSPALQDVAARVIPQIVQDLRAQNVHGRSTALLHLAGDNSDYLTNQLRLAVTTHNVLDLDDASLSERIRDALRMKQPAYNGRDEALDRGQSLGAQCVLFGAVRAFDSDDTGNAKIDLEIQLADVQQKSVLFTHRYTDQLGGTIITPSAVFGGGRMSLIDRILGWAVIVLLLPVFTIMFIRSMVRRGSNSTNAFTLGIYTAVDLLLAYLLLGINLTSWLAALLFLGILAAVLVYNMAVMTIALRLET